MNNILDNEIEQLEALIKEKSAKLSSLKRQKKDEESLKYRMSNFLGDNYSYDRPHKWNSPKIGILSQEDIVSFDYLQFNGIETGKNLNGLYEKEFFENDSLYATFAVPEDDYLDYDENKNQDDYIELIKVYTMLTFKI